MAPSSLLILNDESRVEYGIETYSWNDTRIPNLLDYAIIIATVPSKEHADPKLIEELSQAVRSGSTLVWLLGPASDLDAVSALAGSKVFSLRPGVLGRHFTVANRCFQDYFQLIQGYRHTFASIAPWIPIAYAGNPSVSISLIQYQAAGAILILPAPPPSNTRAYRILLAGCISLSRQQSPETSQRNSALKCLGVALVLAALVTISQMLQHRENRLLLAHELDSSPINSEYAHGQLAISNISTAGLESFAQALPTDPGHLPIDLAETLTFYEWLGLYQKATTLRKAAVAAADEPASLVESYIYTLESASTWLVYRQRYQQVKYTIQRLLNLVDGMPPTEFFSISNNVTDQAQKLRNLTTATFLYDDPSITKTLFNSVVDVCADSIQETFRMNPTLRDHVIYANAKAAVRELWSTRRPSLEEQPENEQPKPSANLEEDAVSYEAAQMWSAVAAQIDNPQLKSQAIYNELLALAKLQRKRGNEPGERSRIFMVNRDCITLGDYFIRHFPSSYLLDDVLLIKLRMSRTIGDNQAAWSAFSELLKTYNGSDAAKRFRYSVDILFWTPKSSQWVSLDHFLVLAASTEQLTLLARIDRVPAFAGADTDGLRRVVSQTLRIAPEQLAAMTIGEVVGDMIDQWLRSEYPYALYAQGPHG